MGVGKRKEERVSSNDKHVSTMEIPAASRSHRKSIVSLKQRQADREEGSSRLAAISDGSSSMVERRERERGRRARNAREIALVVQNWSLRQICSSIARG